MKLLRMDCEPYPMTTFERNAFIQAGIDEIIEINDYNPRRVIEIDAEIIAVISGYLSDHVIEKLSSCKLIMRMGTGYDKINIEAASKKGILVTYVPNYCIHDVAEHCMTLMLASARKLVELSASMDNGNWMQVRSHASVVRLFGKTLGIIGMGRIGTEVGRLANAFGMKILAYDQYYSPDIQYPFDKVSLDDLLACSDFISIHCPLDDHTRQLLGTCEFDKMKSNAILINTARGAVCDEPALADALRNGKIAYAGIDVHEHINVFEYPKTKPYKGIYDGIDNMIVTPHYASISLESWNDCVKYAVNQLKDFLSGRKPDSVINGDRVQVF